MTETVQRLRALRARETKPAVKVVLDRALDLLTEEAQAQAA